MPVESHMPADSHRPADIHHAARAVPQHDSPRHGACANCKGHRASRLRRCAALLGRRSRRSRLFTWNAARSLPPPRCQQPLPSSIASRVPNRACCSATDIAPHGSLTHGSPTHGPPTHGPPAHGPPAHGSPAHGSPAHVSLRLQGRRRAHTISTAASAPSAREPLGWSLSRARCSLGRQVS